MEGQRCHYGNYGCDQWSNGMFALDVPYRNLTIKYEHVRWNSC